MRKLALLSPFLVAAYFVLFYYAANFYQVASHDVLAVIAISLLLAGVLFGINRLIFRELQRSIFVTCLLLILFFMFGHAFNLIDKLVAINGLRTLGALWGLLTIIGLWFAIKKPRYLAGINRFIGLLSGFLIILSLFNIGFSALAREDNAVQAQALFEVHAPTVLPDIYYIVLDEYAGRPDLLNTMGYDNSEFLNSLRDRGFYVVENAHANYFRTFLSLASSLNMTYLDALQGHNGLDPAPAEAMVQHNAAAQMFKQLGYTYLLFASPHPVTSTSPIADVIYNGYDQQEIKIIGNISIDPKLLPVNDYFLSFAETTMFRLVGRTVTVNDSRVRNLFNLEILAEIPDRPEPTFTFAHMMLPHPPFVFTREDGPVNPNGRTVDGQIVDPEKYNSQAPYLDQMVFTNRVISQLVDTILEKSETEPIIIIQGDHGFRFRCPECKANSNQWDDSYYANQVLPVLSTYYLPDGGNALLYPTISPVNSFRVIFNHYFGANLELLEDRYFRAEDYLTRTYDFEEITNLVRAAASAHVDSQGKD